VNIIEPGSIVVGVDGSVESDLAVQWAVEQAQLEGRPLVVLHTVRHVFGVTMDGLGVATAYPVDDLLASALAVTTTSAALARHHRAGVSVEPAALLGDPRIVLVEAAADAHLLVLGSRGRGVIRSKLGSVSAWVSKEATCPVVVCRPGTELTVKRGVVVGADGTPDSLAVIRFAFQQASLRAQPLTVVHCSDDRHPTDANRQDAEESALVMAESVAGFREQYPDVHVQLEYANGRAGHYLARIADVHHLVVVGRHPRADIPRHLTASCATQVLERSHTPVAIIPEAAAHAPN